MPRIRLTQRRAMLRKAQKQSSERIQELLRPVFKQQFKKVERFLRKSNLRKKLNKIDVSDLLKHQGPGDHANGSPQSVHDPNSDAAWKEHVVKSGDELEWKVIARPNGQDSGRRVARAFISSEGDLISVTASNSSTPEDNVFVDTPFASHNLFAQNVLKSTNRRDLGGMDGYEAGAIADGYIRINASKNTDGSEAYIQITSMKYSKTQLKNLTFDIPKLVPGQDPSKVTFRWEALELDSNPKYDGWENPRGTLEELIRAKFLVEDEENKKILLKFETLEMAKGEAKGHPFRGNQWTEGSQESYADFWKPKSIEEIPDTSAHPLFRESNYGIWGGSHSSSWAITGESAELLGIPGYERAREEERKTYRTQAQKMLEKISADETGAEEALYHGFENTAKINWEVGSTFRLPLTACAGEPDTISYGIRGTVQDQKGEPTLLVFPKKTPIVAYSKWKKSDAQEFGYVYSEAITAGEFKVKSVEVQVYPYAWQHDPEARDAYLLKVKVVELEFVDKLEMKKAQDITREIAQCLSSQAAWQIEEDHQSKKAESLLKVQELFKAPSAPPAKPGEWDNFKRALMIALLMGLFEALDSFADIENEFWSSRSQEELSYDAGILIGAYQLRTGRPLEDIAKTTLEGVERLVAKWYDDNASFPDLIRSLDRYFNDTRLATIATTETGNLLAQMTLQQLVEYGLENWYWDAMGEDPCHSPLFIQGVTYKGCSDLNGRRFKVGDPMPPDASHPSCQCIPTPMTIDRNNQPDRTSTIGDQHPKAPPAGPLTPIRPVGLTKGEAAGHPFRGNQWTSEYPRGSTISEEDLEGFDIPDETENSPFRRWLDSGEVDLVEVPLSEVIQPEGLISEPNKSIEYQLDTWRAGQRVPIIAAHLKGDKYVISDGGHRLQAWAKKHEKIPLLVTRP